MAATSFIQQLEKLVDELLKSRPNQSEIQTLMREAGLSYTADPVEQMNAVLSALQKGAKKKAPSHETNV